jgi:hypothetical protein
MPFGFLDLIRHGVGSLWTSDQPVAEASTYADHITYKHKRQTFMPTVRFELAIQAVKTYFLDRSATCIGS